MADLIKHVELVPSGLLVLFADGREALLDPNSLARCVENENGFERLTQLRSQLRREADELPDTFDTES